MSAKKLGVLGGMGPFATSVFLKRIVENTEAFKDQDHIDMVILNHASLPDRTEAIKTNNEDCFLNTIAEDIRLLENSAVSNIAIPCNTSHYFYDEMQKMTSINIINMVHVTVRHVCNKYDTGSKIAVLATDGTILSGVYKNELEDNGLQYFDLNDDQQELVMDTIYSIKSNSIYEISKIESLIHELIFKKGCSCIILACTELSTLDLNKDLKNYCVDALDILVEESIQLSGKNLNKMITK